MDFESPDVEKDFPGLYASETGRKSNESDFSDGADHEKPSKKGLLGQRKDKKEFKKDRGYAALEGESSPEEDTDTKSPSKSKKTKSFKFPTKSKEKREKSRDKEKALEDTSKKELNDKDKKKEKEREKKEKEKREKLKEKDKEKEEKAKFKLESKEKLKDEKKEKVKEKDKDKVKEKDKEKVKEKDKEKVKEKDKEKVKEKDKEKIKDKDKDKVKEKENNKKDKKLIKVPSTVTSGVPFEEIFTLGVALPIFGVPLHQSVERARCHDDTGLPLVVRDSIDYLQEHGLKSTQIYKVEADKIKLQQLRKLYTDRGATFPYHWDVPVACAILKAFISELPSSVLTRELHGQFEQAAAIAEPPRARAAAALLGQLPAAERALLAWLVRHFESVVAHEAVNHVNIQVIATVMGPALNMSLNLLTYFINNAEKLFPDVHLTKYVPPLPSLPGEFPALAGALAAELRKQESLLSQIHAEMHAGFVTPARDQRLWEAQRIVTQLKRKLRSVQKSVEPNSLPAQQPSVEEKPTEEEPTPSTSQIKEPQLPSTSQINEPKIPNTSQINEPKISNNSQIIEAKILSTTQINEPKIPAQHVVNETNKTPSILQQTDVLQEPKQRDSPATKLFSEDTFEDDFDFTSKAPPMEIQDIPPAEPVEKPKLSEKEIKLLRLQLENAEYLQLKSLLQAKINSEQFEIVKLRSHVALKNKQEGNIPVAKENKENNSPEEQELRQRLLKENAVLEQKRLSLINQIFQERVACIQLKIELAMKEIL